MNCKKKHRPHQFIDYVRHGVRAKTQAEIDEDKRKYPMEWFFNPKYKASE